MSRRRLVAVVAVVTTAVAAAALAAARPWEAHANRSTSSAAGGRVIPSSAASSADYFLDHYEQADGQVVRWDQGGDTVSEGQAYAMLLAVVADRHERFAAAWRWSQAHLMQSDGLLSWRYASGGSGSSTGGSSAADADIDTAWALELGASRFSELDYDAAAMRLADAVRGEEVETVAGHSVLLAGPWAKGPAPIVDPSYLALPVMSALTKVDPAGGWSALTDSSRQILAELLDGSHLPPDWAVVVPSGGAHPTAPPDHSTQQVMYGFDAVRVPIWLASSCDQRDTALAAGMWSKLQWRVDHGYDLVDLDLGGGAESSASDAAVGLVGAAASAAAAGQPREASDLLDQADQINGRAPTYYSSAWIALGRALLQTDLLGTCPPLGLS